MIAARNQRALRLAASLGVGLDSAHRRHAARAAALSLAAQRLHTTLSPGGVALITGPSGTGKSTLLGLLPRSPRTITAAPLPRRLARIRVAALRTRTPLTQWAGLLARFGLAEAHALTSPAGALSAGERARLELALAAARCERFSNRATGDAALGVTGASDPGRTADAPSDTRCQSPTRQRERPAKLCEPAFFPNEASATDPHITLIVDEFCSTLDRTTAASIAAGAARWARERRVRLIAATAHDDLATAINADIAITLNAQGGLTWTAYGLNRAG